MPSQQLKVYLVDCGSPKLPEVAAVLRDAGCKLQTVHLADANQTNWSQAQAVVISGGPSLFTDPVQGPLLKEQTAFVKELTQPVLGICLGHQALGLAHGAEVNRGPACRQPLEIELIKEHPLLDSLANPSLFGEDHTEGISLPQGYTLLGRSAVYPVEIMAHDGLKRYGVQFHPEISGEPGRRLMRNFLSLARGDLQP
jgi:GMP synthase-like glutamine amidotransferase